MSLAYRLTLSPNQAHELNKAVELLMRLKLGQYEELPFALMNLGDMDFAGKRDRAKPYLQYAFGIMQGDKRPGEYKDAEWHTLYDLYQVIRHMIQQAEHPDSDGVDSYPPICTGGERLAGAEILWDGRP